MRKFLTSLDGEYNININAFAISFTNLEKDSMIKEVFEDEFLSPPSTECTYIKALDLMGLRLTFIKLIMEYHWPYTS